MRLAWLIGLLFATPGLAADSREEAAQNLIRAMRADELVAQLAERYVRRNCEHRKCEVDLTVCLATMDRGEIVRTLVNIATRELTPAETEAATAYFHTEAGARHLDVIRATQYVGEASMNDQKPEIRTAMLAFLDTSAGYRLVTRAMLTNSDEVNWLIMRTAGQVRDRCRPAQ